MSCPESSRHLKYLNTHCRICNHKFSRSIDKSVVSTECNYIWGLDFSQDREDTHPKNICVNCHKVIKRSIKSKESGKSLRTKKSAHQWKKHNELCPCIRKSGRPSKSPLETTSTTGGSSSTETASEGEDNESERCFYIRQSDVLDREECLEVAELIGDKRNFFVVDKSDIKGSLSNKDVEVQSKILSAIDIYDINKLELRVTV